MEKIDKFEIQETIYMNECVIFIGNIDGTNAIYTIPYPSIDSEFIKEYNVDDEGNCKMPISFTTRLIYPASEEHLKKYQRNYKYTIESLEEYHNNENYLKTSWLDNIIKEKAKNEKVYFEDEECMIIADYKWDRKLMDEMYLLMIFKDDGLKSIRSIRDPQILKRAKNNIAKLCENLNVDINKIAIFFHYRPSYFRLHIHIVNICNTLKFMGSFSRVVFLDDVIRNLSIDSEYYMKDCYCIELKK